MKRILALALSVLALATPLLHAETITTLRGTRYQGCKVRQVHPDGISFTHKHGAAKILFTDLPASVREQYGYSPSKAAAYSKKIAEARQAAEKARQEAATRAAEEAEKAEFDALVSQLHAHSQQMAALAQMQQAGGGSATFNGLTAFSAFPNNIYVPSPVYGPTIDGKPYTQRGPIGWDNVGIAPLIPGVGGVYVPPSGGHAFYPGIVPSLGYARPGFGIQGSFHLGHGVRVGVSAGNMPGAIPGAVIGR